MARPNKIWFRKDTGWWMVTLDGKKVRLAPGKSDRKVAEQKFHELKAVQSRPADRCDARVADVIESFLEWSKVHRSTETCRNHVWYGQQFSEHCGYLKATEVRPIHVTRFVDGHGWGSTTERNARRSVYRAFSWAVEEGLLAANPLKGMKCPGALTRQRAMTDDEFRSLLRASKRNFKVLLFALRMTGCRPKEARTLAWEQVLKDRWVLRQHKTARNTHKPRVIYLTQPMQRLMTVSECREIASRDWGTHRQVAE
jgi:integrase/recombinase XerD